MKKFKVAVLSGGISSERDVSLVSGAHILASLSKKFDTRGFELEKNELPAGISPDEWVVFPAMHGEYGEDGTLQAELESAGFSYAGSPSLSSRACMSKPAAKALMMRAGVPVARGFAFPAARPPSYAEASALLGEKMVLKPADKGSSVGLEIIASAEAGDAALGALGDGTWMLEEFFRGREFSVGILYGKAAGVVEIIPEGGVYDFRRKYTAGSTRYEFPASIPLEKSGEIRRAAEAAFAACGCRDFARADFLMAPSGDFICLEINTLPGMTPTSLLPKSASCSGLGFDELCAAMLEGAAKRFGERA